MRAHVLPAIFPSSVERALLNRSPLPPFPSPRTHERTTPVPSGHLIRISIETSGMMLPRKRPCMMVLNGLNAGRYLCLTHTHSCPFSLTYNIFSCSLAGRLARSLALSRSRSLYLFLLSVSLPFSLSHMLLPCISLSSQSPFRSLSLPSFLSVAHACDHSLFSRSLYLCTISTQPRVS